MFIEKYFGFILYDPSWGRMSIRLLFLLTFDASGILYKICPTVQDPSDRSRRSDGWNTRRLPILTGWLKVTPWVNTRAASVTRQTAPSGRTRNMAQKKPQFPEAFLFINTHGATLLRLAQQPSHPVSEIIS